jgi:hypothetical protein
MNFALKVMVIVQVRTRYIWVAQLTCCQPRGMMKIYREGRKEKRDNRWGSSIDDVPTYK